MVVVVFCAYSFSLIHTAFNSTVVVFLIMTSVMMGLDFFLQFFFVLFVFV